MITQVIGATVGLLAMTIGVAHWRESSSTTLNQRIGALPNHRIIQSHISTTSAVPRRQYQAFVVGATGAVGKALVQELLQSDSCSKVVTLTRRPIPDVVNNDKLKQIIVSDNDLYLDHNHIQATVLPEIQSFDVAFSAFGTTRKDAGSAKEFERIDRDMNLFFVDLAYNMANIPHYSLVSSMNADKNSWLLYPRCKGEIEDRVIQQQKQQLDRRHYSIFRPGLLITDRGSRKRFAEEVAQKVSPYITPVICVGSLRRYREIKVEDVARAMRVEFESRFENRLRNESEASNVQETSSIYESDQIQLIHDLSDKQ